MTDWRHIGAVAHLQVHRGLVVASKRYDVGQLATTAELAIDAGGAAGLVDGAWIVDVHHAAHPANIHGSSDRALSIGFTDHYRLISERFGEMPLGVGGENIIVTSDRRVRQDDLSGGVRIDTADGPVILVDPKPAQPCVPFTRFLLGEPDTEDVTEPRSFLRDGMRGYVFATDRLSGAAVVRLGDLVHAAV